MEIRRGDLVTIAWAGDYGKPRPALVIQDDAFEALASITVLPLTSELRDWTLFRITIEPSQGTGLRRRSQVMVHKAATVSRSRIGQRIGRLDPETILAVSAALAKFLGLGWFGMPRP
jgi:mRNA interferase MazF